MTGGLALLLILLVALSIASLDKNMIEKPYEFEWYQGYQEGPIVDVEFRKKENEDG